MTEGIIVAIIGGVALIGAAAIPILLKFLIGKNRKKDWSNESQEANEEFVNWSEDNSLSEQESSIQGEAEIMFAAELKQNSPNGDIIEIFDLNKKEN